MLAYRGDDREYSGWTVRFPSLVDLSSVHKTGGLQIRFRGIRGGEKLILGLLDDESDGPERRTQTRLALNDFAKVTTDWQTVTIPLGSFEDNGYWWNAAKHAEILAAMDWKHIAEFRISSEQGANSKVTGDDHRFEFQVAEMRLVPEAPQAWSAAAHWKAFHSTEPDRAVWKWDSTDRTVMATGADPSSTMAAKLDSLDGVRVLRLDYQVGKWVFAGAKPPMADWSRHAGLAVRLHTKRSTSMVQFALIDSTGEQWVATATAHAGWNDLLVPFADFVRNPWYQPDNAGTDRRLDLGRVNYFQVQPQDVGIPGRIDLASIALTNRGSSTGANGPDPTRILIDLEGWTPGAVKRFLVAGSAGKDFAILDSSGKSVFVAALSPLGHSDLSGQDLSVGDFSKFVRPGKWRIAVDTLRSTSFVIAPDVHASIFRDALRAFYFQRASVALPESLAGVWARAAGHPDTGLDYIEAKPARKGKGAAPGGWYDAGDYGKYVVNGGISVATLLTLQDLEPKLVPDGFSRIPESRNGVGDLLDEVRWELDWMSRMQDEDGGVFFKLASTSWNGMILPASDDLPRHIIGKTTASTLNYAAVAAQASRLWKGVDPKYSASCLVRAEKAWSWAKAHPDVSAPSEHGGSGSYADSQFDDEFFWAASELWLASGKKSYRTEIASRIATLPMLESADWERTQNLGYYSLALHAGTDSLGLIARGRLDTVAANLRATLDGSPLRIPTGEFRWGSNGDLANRGVILALHHRLSGNRDDLDAMTEIVDYLLGRNPNGASYVSGHGEPSLKHPHLRYAVAGGQDAPPPGLLSGGPNAGRQDDLSHDPGGVRYTHSEPARCWIDDHRSYASNEIAINWNAPLALVLGYLDSHKP